MLFDLGFFLQIWIIKFISFEYKMSIEKFETKVLNFYMQVCTFLRF